VFGDGRFAVFGVRARKSFTYAMTTSIGARFSEAFSRLLFREATVTRVQELSANFRRIELSGQALRGLACNAGDKVQVLLSRVGSRTYTPFAYNRERGAFELLLYAHGQGPGAEWSRRVALGDRLRLLGPRSSLSLTSLTGPVVLFGDETSFAVARALRDVRGPSSALDFVFEVSHRGESEVVLDELGIGERHLVEKGEAETHLAAVEAELGAALGRSTGAQLILTGKAQSIQALRRALRLRPVAPGRQKTKAYWSVGKRGLD
jgi:ferric-chelate reductase (NADPH)